MELLILFILKLLDNTLSTLKNIFLIKNKNFLSSLCNTLAMFFYLTMLTSLTKNSSYISIIIICISAFIGSYIPQVISDKLEKDKIFTFTLIPFDNTSGKQLADDLRELNFAVHTYKGYNANKEEVLCAKVFSETKLDSIKIEQIITGKCNYTISEIRNFINN